MRVVRYFLCVISMLIFYSHLDVYAASEQLTVEASGSGPTKMAAMKDAWTDAVRKAVGMYMATKTEINNEELIEQISAYSRGQINSYELLSEDNSNGIWTVKIRARIDKDVMQEAATQTQSQTVSIDGANLAAQQTSALNKKEDAIETLKTSNLLDFSPCLDYQAAIETIEIKGEPVIFMRHILKMDVNRFQKQANELEKLLSQLATSKFSCSLQNKLAANAIKLLTNGDYKFSFPIDLVKKLNIDFSKMDSSMLSTLNRSDVQSRESLSLTVFSERRDEHTYYLPQENTDTWTGLLANACFLFEDLNKAKNAECIVKNSSSAICYRLPESLLQNIAKPVIKEARFGVEQGEGLTATSFQTSPVWLSTQVLLPYGFQKESLPYFNAPAFRVWPGGGIRNYNQKENIESFFNSSLISPLLIVYQKLSLGAEALADLSKLKAGYELAPIEESQDQK